MNLIRLVSLVLISAPLAIEDSNNFRMSPGAFSKGRKTC
jgi:hypothetical protein